MHHQAAYEEQLPCASSLLEREEAKKYFGTAKRHAYFRRFKVGPRTMRPRDRQSIY